MSQREDYDEIHDSIVNGQFKQAVSQMESTEYSIEDMLDYFFHELCDTGLALRAAKLYIAAH